MWGAGRAVRGLLCVALVLSLALFLRLYRITEESPWYDEAVTLRHLDNPEMSAFIEDVHDEDSFMTPAYFIGVYTWTREFGTSVLAARMLSVLFSVGTVVALFACGLRLGGNRGAILAGLWIACSPLQIFYQQEVRNYALLLMLSAIALYALFRILDGGRWLWWALSALCCVALQWTHLFGSLFVAACGLVLFFHTWKKPAPWKIWGCTCAVLAARLALAFVNPVWLVMAQTAAIVLLSPYLGWLAFRYFRGWRPVPIDWMSLPMPLWVFTLGCSTANLLEFMQKMGIDYVAPSMPWLPRTIAVADVYNMILYALGVPYPFVGFDSIPLVIELAVLGAVALLAWKCRQRKTVAVLWLVPVVSLAVMTLAYTPCFVPRYVQYTSLVVPLILASGIPPIQRRWLRETATGCVVALCCLLALGSITHRPHRGQWDNVLAYVRQFGAHEVVVPQEPMSVSGCNIQFGYQEKYGIEPDIRYSLEDAIKVVDASKKPESFVILGEAESRHFDEFAKCARARGWRFTHKSWYSARGPIVAIRVLRDSSTLAGAAPAALR